MGCVSSKHLKQQASLDGWRTPPSRTIARTKTVTVDYSVECHHRHFVSLTSSSYGLLKVESPKPAEARLTHDRKAVGSLCEMYGKLRSLEMADAAPIAMPLYDFNNMQNTFKPCANKSPSAAPLESAHQWNTNSPEVVLSETINVTDMMMGLEEAAPSQRISPARRVATSTADHPNTKILVSRQQNRQLQQRANTVHVSAHGGTYKNSSSITSTERSDGDGGFGKENSSPCHSRHTMEPLPKSTTFSKSTMGNTSLSQISHSSSKAVTSVRNASSLIPLSQRSQPSSKSTASRTIPPGSNAHRAREFQPIRRESIVTRKAAIDRASSCSGTQISKSSPASSSTSSATARSVHYAPSNGKVKLTLHAQHQNDPATLRTHSSMPSRSTSRRQVVGGGFSSAEPSSPTFDPDLVASYEKDLKTVSQGDWNASHVKGKHCSPASIGQQHRSPASVGQQYRSPASVGQPLYWSSKSMPTAELDKKLYDPLECFKRKCPPGGEEAVVLYTTTLRGIRKTFEDCNTAREILQSFSLRIDERDVSMHLEFLNELRELMGRVVSVPRMFIKGRYIGGTEELVKLHEDGKLSELVEGLPKQVDGGNCDGCGGVRFVPCLECSGSCKVRIEEGNRIIRCPDCNENGLIQCPICT
eukprot:c24716_g1_i1 orf=745-2673(-)